MHGSRSRPPLPISSLGLDLSLSLDLNLGLGGQYFIFQARRPKFCKVTDLGEGDWKRALKKYFTDRSRIMNHTFSRVSTGDMMNKFIPLK